jgi:uridine kinase
MHPVLIGIAGASCSGKTRLARGLAEALDGEVSIFSLDHYYADRGHIPEPERSNFNFDHPSALEAGLLLEHLRRLKKGETISQPRYCFETHSRLAGAEEFTPTEIVLVEGLFSLHWKEVRDLLDLRIYMETAEEECRSRRLERDTKERGRTVESIEKQYAETVAPMAEQYIFPTKAHADWVLSGTAPVEENVARVLAWLSAQAAVKAIAPA